MSGKACVMEFVSISKLKLMGNFLEKSVQNSFLRTVSPGMKMRPHLISQER